MKHLILCFAWLGAFAAQAQKDVSVAMLSPVTGLQVGANQGFNVTFSVKNESSATTIQADDTVLIAFYLNAQLLTFGGGALFMFDHPSIAPGDTMLRGMNLSFSVAPPPNSLFCIRVLLTRGGAIDANPNNDIWCLPINVGVGDEVSAPVRVSVYPNPASEYVTFEGLPGLAASLSVTDMTGRRVDEMRTNGPDARLFTGHYPSGIYLYSIHDESGRVLHTGKLNVKN